MIKSSWIIIKIQEKGQELLHVKQVMTSAQEKSSGKLEFGRVLQPNESLVSKQTEVLCYLNVYLMQLIKA